MQESSAVALTDLVDYLDRYLETASFADASANGLQVEGGGPVGRIGLAVDACLETVSLASKKRCDLLLVHHGLFWGADLRLCGHMYQRVRGLIRADIALYASHLPLDAHPEVGNNIQIARRMSLADVRPFGFYGGRQIGFQGDLEGRASLQDVIAVCSERIGPPKSLLRFGPEQIRRVAVVSGSASDPPLLEEASREGIDLLITGEPKQPAYYLAREYGLNIYFGGHYCTETFGVKALGEHLSARFGLPAEFLETACPY